MTDPLNDQIARVEKLHDEVIEILRQQRDQARGELEAANQHVKILQADVEDLKQDQSSCRLYISVSPFNERQWHTLIQAQTDLSEPPDVDDSSYHPDIHQAVHHAWTILNRLQGYFKDPYAKSE